MNDISYNNFISQFKIYPTYNSARHKGFEAHHIIPRALQKESEFDDRCVRLTPFEHVYAHYLLALEDPEAITVFTFMVSYNFSKLSELEKITLEQLKEWSRLREEGRLLGEKHPNYGKHLTEEQKIKRAQKCKEFHLTHPELDQNHSKHMKQYYSSEEKRQWCSERSKLAWKDSDYRKAVTDAIKDRWSNDDYRKTMSQKHKDVWTEERKQEWSIKQKEIWSSEETRQKASVCSKRFWSDPSNKKKMSEKHTGLIGWNNGIVNKRSKECPGPEWKRGFLKKEA